jgi:hypothetical protein
MGHASRYGHALQGWILPMSLLLGLIIYFILSPLIYRLFRLPPLLLPECPNYQKRPNRYDVIEARWPRKIVICRNCNQKSELWYKPPASKDVSKVLPGMYLAWPQTIGNWRPVATKDSA